MGRWRQMIGAQWLVLLCLTLQEPYTAQKNKFSVAVGIYLQ